MNTEKTLYTLTNESLTVSISALGASIRTIRLNHVPKGRQNVVLSFRQPEAYINNSLYAGATLAPAAGRIKDGDLLLDGRHYPLTRNENGKTHLHGGPGQLSFTLWETLCADSSRVQFRSYLPNGLDGYPGNRTFLVEYQLLENSLTILLQMESDRPTYANLSNHAYYNLNGFCSVDRLPDGLSGLCQYFQTEAEQVILNDMEHIPQQTVNTSGTAFDFSNPVLFSKMLSEHKNSPQLQAAKGYNHYFLTQASLLKPACILQSYNRELEMRMYTDAPAFVLYSGGFIDHSHSLLTDDNSRLLSYPGCGIAIEPSGLPPALYPQSGRFTAERTILLEWSCCQA